MDRAAAEGVPLPLLLLEEDMASEISEGSIVLVDADRVRCLGDEVATRAGRAMMFLVAILGVCRNASMRDVERPRMILDAIFGGW